MRRHFGSPGRIDLAAVHSPIRPGGRLEALLGFAVVTVILIGVALLGLAAYQFGAHQAQAVLAQGG